MSIAIDLMAENQTLRNLLKSLAAFIGEGAGGLLPKLGWDLSDFNNFINKSETDTAWEGFHRRKKNPSTNADGESLNATSQTSKRSAEGDLIGTVSKKSRNEDNDGKDNHNGFSLLASMPNSASIPPPPPLYPPAPRNGMFSDIIGGPNGSPMFMHSANPSASSQYASTGGSNLDRYSSAYMSNVNVNIDHRGSSYDSPASHNQQHVQDTNDTGGDDQEVDDDPKKNEAYKLIQ